MQVLRKILEGEMMQDLLSLQMLTKPLSDAAEAGAFSSHSFYQPGSARIWRDTAVSFAVLRARLVSRVVIRYAWYFHHGTRFW